MDLDVFVAEHRAEWERLEELLRRRSRLTGPQADELVTLYQRASTHLSLIRTSTPDPALTGRLTSLVARARNAVTGPRRSAWRDAAHFFASAPRPCTEAATGGFPPPWCACSRRRSSAGGQAPTRTSVHRLPLRTKSAR